jgi:hypothetical protein
LTVENSLVRPKPLVQSGEVFYLRYNSPVGTGKIDLQGVRRRPIVSDWKFGIS